MRACFGTRRDARRGHAPLFLPFAKKPIVWHKPSPTTVSKAAVYVPLTMSHWAEVRPESALPPHGSHDDGVVSLRGV